MWIETRSTTLPWRDAEHSCVFGFLHVNWSLDLEIWWTHRLITQPRLRNPFNDSKKLKFKISIGRHVSGAFNVWKLYCKRFLYLTFTYAQRAPSNSRPWDGRIVRQTSMFQRAPSIDTANWRRFPRCYNGFREINMQRTQRADCNSTQPKVDQDSNKAEILYYDGDVEQILILSRFNNRPHSPRP